MGSARVLRAAVRVALAGVFATSAITKAYLPTASGAEGSVPTLAEPHSGLLAMCEALLAVWLLSGIWGGGAAIVCVVAMSLFSGVIAVELSSARPRDCGCFGGVAASIDTAVVSRHLRIALIRNGALIFVAAWLACVADSPATSRLGQIAGTEEGRDGDDEAVIHRDNRALRPGHSGALGR